MSGVTLNTRMTLLHSFGSGSGTTIGIINAFGSTAFAGQPAVPAANQKWGVYRMILTVGNAALATLTIQDTGPNNVSGTFQLPINGGVTLPVSENGDPWLQATQNGLGMQLFFGSSVTCGFDVWWLPTV